MLGFIELSHDMLLENKVGSNNPYASNFAFMKISCCNQVFRYTLCFLICSINVCLDVDTFEIIKINFMNKEVKPHTLVIFFPVF
ncbi:unnamed protein product [Camellia sinensis]